MAALVAAALCVCGLAFAPSASWAQGASGYDSVEVTELKAALETALKKLKASQAKLADLEKSRDVMAESLAQANAEAETNRKAYRDLLISMEALGIDVLSPDPSGLQQRLLKAVRDLDLVNQENEKLSEQLLRLSETVVAYMQTTVGSNDETREAVTAELHNVDEVLGLTATRPDSAPTSLSEARVVSIDPEVGLVVLNVGKNSGVRVGMPLQVFREDRPVGTALVVDTRDSVSGALLQELALEGDDVRVGDRVRPRPQQAL